MEEKPRKKYKDKRTYEERKEYMIEYQRERYHKDPFFRNYKLKANTQYVEKNKDKINERRKYNYHTKPEVKERICEYQRNYYKNVLKPKLEGKKNNIQNNKNNIN